MRWQEILLLTETDVDEEIKKELSALLGIMKMKGVKTFPLEKIVSQTTYNGMPIDTTDDAMMGKIVNILTSLSNLVEKVEGDVIHIKFEGKPEYKANPDKTDKDKKEIKKSATDVAKKKIKSGDIKL